MQILSPPPHLQNPEITSVHLSVEEVEEVLGLLGEECPLCSETSGRQQRLGLCLLWDPGPGEFTLRLPGFSLAAPS